MQISMKASGAVCLALLALLCVSIAPAHGRALLDADELDRAARDSNGKYKNDRPLIGILTQACHYCPGRCVCDGVLGGGIRPGSAGAVARAAAPA